MDGAYRMLQLLAEIADKLGVRSASDGIEALEQATRPSTLAEQIERANSEQT